jgi:hypothetical protein
MHPKMMGVVGGGPIPLKILVIIQFGYARMRPLLKGESTPSKVLHTNQSMRR